MPGSCLISNLPTSMPAPALPGCQHSPLQAKNAGTTGQGAHIFAKFIERGDVHRETFRKKEGKGGTRRRGPAVMNLEMVVGRLRSAALAAG